MAVAQRAGFSSGRFALQLPRKAATRQLQQLHSTETARQQAPPQQPPPPPPPHRVVLKCRAHVQLVPVVQQLRGQERRSAGSCVSSVPFVAQVGAGLVGGCKPQRVGGAGVPRPMGHASPTSVRMTALPADASQPIGHASSSYVQMVALPTWMSPGSKSHSRCSCGSLARSVTACSACRAGQRCRDEQ